MPLTFSNKEIGLLYRLLRSVGDEFLEKVSSDHPIGDIECSASEEAAKHVRLNKLIASNLKQKMHFELRHSE